MKIMSNAYIPKIVSLQSGEYNLHFVCKEINDHETYTWITQEQMETLRDNAKRIYEAISEALNDLIKIQPAPFEGKIPNEVIQRAVDSVSKEKNCQHESDGTPSTYIHCGEVYIRHKCKNCGELYK